MRRHKHEEYLTENERIRLAFENLPVLSGKLYVTQRLHRPEKACTALKLVLLSIFLSLLLLS